MTPKESRNKALGESVIKALKSRHFDAYYADTSDDAVRLALELINEGESVSWGGSMTIRDMGLTKAIIDSGEYTVLDRDNAKDGEDIARMAFSCDTYLMSANALTEDGVLVNMDGNGNRAAALIFGPKSVIVLVGVNKIVRDTDAAVSRTRNTAAPINAARFNISTPCKQTGVCADCKCEDSICANLVITRLCRPAGRIKVIIVGEELGY